MWERINDTLREFVVMIHRASFSGSVSHRPRASQENLAADDVTRSGFPALSCARELIDDSRYGRAPPETEVVHIIFPSSPLTVIALKKSIHFPALFFFSSCLIYFPSIGLLHPYIL